MILVGHLAEVILGVVHRTDADSVVVGAQGRPLVGEVVLGSVSHRVLQGSIVPVLVAGSPRKAGVSGEEEAPPSVRFP